MSDDQGQEVVHQAPIPVSSPRTQARERPERKRKTPAKYADEPDVPDSKPRKRKVSDENTKKKLRNPKK